jgi:hypothetical protein
MIREEILQQVLDARPEGDFDACCSTASLI